MAKEINVQSAYEAYVQRRDKAILIKKLKKALPVWEEAFQARKNAGFKFIPLAEMQALYKGV